MKILCNLSSCHSDSPTSTPEPPPRPETPPRPAAVFAFTQINVEKFDRAEAFFEKVFGWRFVGEPAAAAFIAPAVLQRGPDEEPRVRVAPPIAPPPDHRVNYFTEVGHGRIAGGLFKFGPKSTAGNYGGYMQQQKQQRQQQREQERQRAMGLPGRERYWGRIGGWGDDDDEKPEPTIPSVISYVAVEDMAIALNAVRLAGGRTVVQPWMERDRMAWFALFEDTEGNVFGFVQYLK